MPASCRSKYVAAREPATLGERCHLIFGSPYFDYSYTLELACRVTQITHKSIWCNSAFPAVHNVYRHNVSIMLKKPSPDLAGLLPRAKGLTSLMA